MTKVPLKIIALSNSESQPGNYTLVLEEVIGNRRIPIIIGPYEAQTISLSLDNDAVAQPMAYDFFKTILDSSTMQILEVVISDIREDKFITFMNGLNADGTVFSAAVSTSSAIALSLRLGIPVFSSAKVMNSIGIAVGKSGKVLDMKYRKLTDFSLPELIELLSNVIEEEDYESAIKIRDTIEQRKTLNDRRA